MRILVVTPEAETAHSGNWVTARRWRALLGDLDHEVTVAGKFTGQAGDLLVAVHARRSAPSVRRFQAERPGRGIVLVLSGTDLYPDLATGGADPVAMAAADRLVVLQPLALDQLPAGLRHKARVVVQSAVVAPNPGAASPGSVPDRFKVVSLAHLRPVKDPLLLAAAARLVPSGSAIEIEHLGAALDPDLGAAAAAESASASCYRWLGDVDRQEALGRLAGADLAVVTSRHEGGANAVSEALAAGVPVVSTRIAGSIGLLGAGYPGYVPVGDAPALAHLLVTLEADRQGAYAELLARCAALGPMVEPASERASLAALVAELALEPRPA